MEEMDYEALVNEAWDDDAPDTTDDFDEAEESEAEEEKESEEETAEPVDETVSEEQTETEKEEVSEPDAETPAEEPKNESFEITYLGNKETYTREQMTELAQKGRNYDHVNTQNKELKSELESYKEFFKALDPDHSAEEIMDNALARVLADKEKVDISVAQQRIKLDRERKQLEKSQREEREKAEAEQARQESFRKFADSHPDLKATDIPKEVWERVGNGEDLSTAYDSYENKQLKEQLKKLQADLEAEKQNSKNASRSTGSSKSAGNSRKKSTFDEEIDAIWSD